LTGVQRVNAQNAVPARFDLPEFGATPVEGECTACPDHAKFSQSSETKSVIKIS
jgi:hypothetical protein